jgi:hypothetical protein
MLPAVARADRFGRRPEDRKPSGSGASAMPKDRKRPWNRTDRRTNEVVPPPASVIAAELLFREARAF